MADATRDIHRIGDLIDLEGLPYPDLVRRVDVAPWEALNYLDDFFLGFVFNTHVATPSGAYIDGNVSIGEGSVIEPGAVIFGPTVIGKNCRVRSGATIRGSVVIGDNCVIGHASEIKHSILFRGCQVAHFNYVGDSILGNRAHLAAGAIIANVRIAGGTVTVRAREERVDTGLVKFGAVLGDDAEIGCNAVLNPGSIIGKNSIVYPLVSWRGILSSGMIAKSAEICVLRV